VQTLFEPPPNTALSSGSMSPEGQQLALAYAPPPPEGEIQFGFTGLYLLPGDGQGPPEPVVEHIADNG
jgi:hypothetical protein